MTKEIKEIPNSYRPISSDVVSTDSDYNFEDDK